MSRLGALIAAAAMAARVHADPLPASLIERPLILSRLMFQPVVEGNLTNTVSPDDYDTMQQGGSIGFGLDVGVGSGLQLGFFFAFPVAPISRFGDFVASLQAGLVRGALNLRFDVGAEQFVEAPPGALVGIDTFMFGIGLPFRIRLHKRVAIVSGSTSTRGFGTPLLINQAPYYRPGQQWIGAALTSNDVFAMQANADLVAGSVFLPIGLLIQPHPLISFAFRSGYRFLFSRRGSGTVEEHFIPLAADLTFNISRRVDVGFTATVLGLVDARHELPPGTDFFISVRGQWWEIQRYDLFVAARF
jgi:hypothetical protein